MNKVGKFYLVISWGLFRSLSSYRLTISYKVVIVTFFFGSFENLLKAAVIPSKNTDKY